MWARRRLHVPKTGETAGDRERHNFLVTRLDERIGREGRETGRHGKGGRQASIDQQYARTDQGQLPLIHFNVLKTLLFPLQTRKRASVGRDCDRVVALMDTSVWETMRPPPPPPRPGECHGRLCLLRTRRRGQGGRLSRGPAATLRLSLI